jgi:Ribonuclease G/E
MTRRLIIQCGGADTRAALVLGEEIVGFWFGPARGDEDLPRPPQAGEVYSGRIRTVSKPLNAAFVDIGAAREALLPLKPGAAAPQEGASVVALVRRPPTAGKGAVLTVDLDDAASEALARVAGDRAPPFRVGAPTDPATEAWRWAIAQGAPLDAILVNDPTAAAALAQNGAAAVIDPDAFASAGGDEALDSAFERDVALAGGARMIVDETEALVAVDIDAAHAASGAEAGKLNNRVNHAAAGRLFRELARRGAGGRVVVDFLPPSDGAARRRLSDALKAAASGVFPARFGRLSEDGLFDLTAPRRRLSLLEEATEPCAAGAVRQGRRFTLDWRAKTAVRALEARLEKARSQRLTLYLSMDLHHYLLSVRPQWFERVRARYGARFEARRDDTFEERRFDVAE